MEFTIDNFKTRIIRPAEYIFASKDISFLTAHTIHDADQLHEFTTLVDYDGLKFELGIEEYKHDPNIPTIHDIVSIEFEKHLDSDDKYAVTFRSSIKPLLLKDKDGCCLTYWAADQLLKRIESDIFKQLAKIESFDDEAFPVKK